MAERNGGEEAGAARAFLREIYPGLLLWHRYLATYRDPEESGLVTIYHPWESGTDNSPRWDAPLAAVEVGNLAPYPRYDLQHVANPSQRPADADYDRYLWLVRLIKKASCDEGSINRSYHPFLVKDVLFSAILVAANEALLEIAGLVGAHKDDGASIADWIDHGRRGLERCWDPELGLCLDHDLRAGKPLRVRTVAGFAPLIAGRLSPERLEALIAALDSPEFLGHPWLRWPVPPSTSPFQEGFHRQSYWRGPTWPVVNWLLWWSLLRAGKPERAEKLRQASLQQIASSGFGEYFDPFTGELLGATDPEPRHLADRYAARAGARLAARDLLHAALMLRAEGDAAKIVSSDSDFDELAVEGLERLDPTDIEVWRHEVERAALEFTPWSRR